MTTKMIAAILLFISSTCYAQPADSIKNQLLKDWKRSKQYTLDCLTAMPADKYAFRPQDSIRTFAQQLIHMAQGTISLMNAATGLKIPALINRQNLENTPSALTADSVRYFTALSYDYAAEALANFNMAEIGAYVKRGNFNETRLAWMLKAYEHQAHHRGQTIIYIRTVGIKPPNERLFDK